MKTPWFPYSKMIPWKPHLKRLFSPFHKLVSCTVASGRKTQHCGSAPPEQTRCRELKVSAASATICPFTGPLSGAKLAFLKCLRHPKWRLLLPSKVAHQRGYCWISAGVRVKVTENVFGSVTRSVKWCILDWVKMEATGSDFISDFISPLKVTDRILQANCDVSGEGRGGDLSASTAAKYKNYDISSARNHVGFKDELSRSGTYWEDNPAFV